MLAVAVLLPVLGLALCENSTSTIVWECPDISQSPIVSCSCDLPHTLRCTGESSALEIISGALMDLEPSAAVSLLDCTIQDLTVLSDNLLKGVSLHGLVISSGEIRQVSRKAFLDLKDQLQALGLPNNKLDIVPTTALAVLYTLQRLDLSHNVLKTLGSDSFQGLYNLTFLDLSENVLMDLKPDSLKSVHQLKILRLKGNKITFTVIAALKDLSNLEDLDLSDNLIIGPLDSKSFPKLSSLHSLDLTRNQLSSIRRDALQGFESLTSMSLHHNEIDVIEDDAFRQLSSLQQLDLSHNRIVAVSENSLAHLINLVKLDLSHNFLRALTADITVPLKSLQDLHLDDNDISMVTNDALQYNSTLNRLTLSDNPLNCDCSLSSFAIWLSNSTNISKSDRETAVCTTPPSLENGLLLEISASELACNDNDASEIAPPEGPLSDSLPVSKTKIMLRRFHYDGSTVSMVWHVKANTVTYTCDNLYVYEEIGSHEVLTESNPLHCNSSDLMDPQLLPITFAAADFIPGHRYRYCIVLLEGSASTDDVTLILGCSEIIPLVQTSKFPVDSQPAFRHTISSISIAALHANITSTGVMTVKVQIWNDEPILPQCVLTATVFAKNSLVVQKHFNCSVQQFKIVDLTSGPYRVCVSIGKSPSVGPRARCITAQQLPSSHESTGGLNIALSIFFVILSSFLVAGMYLVVKRYFFQSKLINTHQYFIAPPEEDRQHNQYVKLQTTSKL